MKTIPFVRYAASLLFLVPVTALRAWDYEGHQIVNRLALESLPKGDFPDFVLTSDSARDRIAFLAGEPDRWKSTPDLPIKHYNGVDHYLDLEEVSEAGLDPHTISSLRYDFVVQFAAGRAAHSDKFPPIDPKKNLEHSREWPGFAPWAITEYYGKLKAAFSYLKAFQEQNQGQQLGTSVEVTNAKDNIIYLMGIMGHYVGDCAQPLHVTMHHNGWVGPNPNGYTTWSGIHAWIDGGLIGKTGINWKALTPQITPSQAIVLAPQADGRDPMFVDVMNYLLGSLDQVEPLYRLEKDHKFGDDFAKGPKTGQDTETVSAEGRAFVEAQLVRGGEKLGAIWLTAWRNSPPDAYLRAQLLKRQASAGPVDPRPAVEYWASSHSSKHLYHKSTCEWAQKIKESNKVVFKTKEEAEAAGYVPCDTCKP